MVLPGAGPRERLTPVGDRDGRGPQQRLQVLDAALGAGPVQPVAQRARGERGLVQRPERRAVRLAPQMSTPPRPRHGVTVARRRVQLKHR